MATIDLKEDETTTGQEQNGQTVRLSKSESAATVNTVCLNKDEHDRGKKDAEKQKKAGRKRFIAQAESAAKVVEENYKQLVDLDKQDRAIYRKFAAVVEEMRPQLETVRHFFAHRKQDELLLGSYHTGDEWSNAVLNVSYRHLCRCLNPPAERPFLGDGTDESTPKQKQITKSKDGSAPYVNEANPEYEEMKAMRLIGQDADCEDEEAEAPKQNSETLGIKRKDGCTIPESAASVKEIVRTDFAFVISNHRSLNAEDNVQAIERLIATLKSERDFILADVEIVTTKSQPTASTDAAEPLSLTPPVSLKTKQSKNKNKLEAVIHELSRIDSILDAAPVDDEFGAYVDKSNYKLLDKQEKLKKKLELLEKAVDAEESDNGPTEETMQVTAA